MNKVGVRTAVGIAMCGFVLAAPLAASAAGLNHLDAYYIPDSTLELEDDTDSIESEDGDGFGVKLAAMLGQNIFLAGEYQSTDNQKLAGTATNATVDSARIGLGYDTSTPFYGLLEYIDYEAEVEGGLGGDSGSESGFGVHIGASLDLFEHLTLEARGGYLDIGDADGFEYLAGIGLNLDKNFGLFVDYRVTELENKDDLTLTVEDLRTGFRFRF